MSNLGEVCNDLKVPTGNIDYSKYKTEKPSSDEMFNKVHSLCSILGNEILVYGGQSVHPKLLGHKKLRRASNDIDCVITARGIKKIVDTFEPEHYFLVKDREDIFLEFEGIPVGFNLDYIHDWQIPQDFLDSKVSFSVDDVHINCASPEYTIMMKIRRAECKQRFFGKDKLDIANILIASSSGSKPYDFDASKTANLLQEHVTSCQDTINKWFDYVSLASTNLSEIENYFFHKTFDNLYLQVEKTFANSAKYSNSYR